MFKNSILLTSLIFTFVLTSCVFLESSIKGNGEVVEQVRPIGNFHGIKVSRGMNVYVSQGDTEKVIVKADDNLLNSITTNVEDGILLVSSKDRIKWAKSKKVFVTIKYVDKITTSSGSNIFSETFIHSENLDLSCSSGSNMKLELNVKSLEASASSGANMSLRGKVENIEIDASSGSNIKAGELESIFCDAETTSGANIWISVNESLNGKATSGGNLNYYGNPQKTNVHTSSGGNIRKK